jgi:uroporphyrin-3 C-methyltransferase
MEPVVARAVPVRQRHPALVLAAIALVLIVILTFATRNWLAQTREDFGRRVQEVASQIRSDKDQLASNTAKTDNLNVRLALLEAKLQESTAQQQALEALYQNLLKNRDETALADVEQIVALAAQQLQLIGNAEGALLALQQADIRLGSAERPGFANLRKALRRDIDRLRALPKVDVPRLALQLDDVARKLDGLPMMSEPGHGNLAVQDTAADQSAPAGVAVDAPLTWYENFWQITRQALTRLTQAVWNDLRRLVSIREVSNPDALLLTPTQNYFVRQSMRLQLLNARWALLSRQQAILRSDLSSSRQNLVRYFDVRDPQVKDVIETLDLLLRAQVDIELPNLADSLSALRLSRTPPGRETGR